MDNIDNSIVEIRPKQRVSYAEKQKPEWQKNNVTFWASKCVSNFFTNKDLLVLYKAAAGVLEEEDYTYITNPLNAVQTELKGYPAKMRNIDIISTNINVLRGELLDRFFNPVVVALNADIDNKKYQEDYKVIVDYLKQEFVNGLAKDGIVPEEQMVQQSLEALEKKLSKNYKDEMSKIGQDAMDYIQQACNVLAIRRKTFYDMIVGGKMFTYRDIANDELEYSYVSPFELSWLATANVDFVEDAPAVKRTVKMTLNQIIDKFYGVKGFDKTVIDYLETNITSSNSPMESMQQNVLLTKLFNFNNPNGLQDSVFVEHVQWTAMAEMLKVTGVNLDGSTYEEEYDEFYKPLEGEKVERHWVNEKWEGYRIANLFVVGVQPIEYQRGTINAPHTPKNSYNGRVYNNNYVIPESIGKKGLVYQIKYNIVHYLMELTLAKNMDKLVIFPLGLVPEKEGFDMFTTMYYAKAHGFLFVDETNEKVGQALQYMKSLDMGLGNYINESYKILTEIKNDWNESIGITNSRKGAVSASSGKAVTQEAVYRSAVITEELFMQHEETIMKDLQCLLDLSKVAWHKGKKATFMSSDFKLKQLEIDPTVYQSLDMGVFVKNSGQEAEKIKAFRNQIGTIAQQTQNFSLLGEILDASNMSQLVSTMKELEDKLAETQQAQAQKENELAQGQLDSQEKDRQLEIYKIDEANEVKREDIAAKKEIEYLKLQYEALGTDVNNNQVADNIELEKIATKREEIFAKIEVEYKKLAEATRKRLQDGELQREKNRIELKKANQPKTTKK